MTSTGGSSPVQCRKAWAAWWMSMPSPLTATAPRAAGRGDQRGRGRLVDEVDHQLAASDPLGVERQVTLGAHADGRGVHDQVGVSDLVGACRPDRPARPGRRPPRPVPAVRFTTTTSRGAGVGQRRAPPPGPRPRHRGPPPRRPAGSYPSSWRSASTKPAPSVLSPTSSSPRHHTQFTASRAVAIGVHESTEGSHGRLVRHRHRHPRERDGPHHLDGVGRVAVRAPTTARYFQRRPSASNAALCITGESEWSIGRPITAASLTAGARALPAPEPLRLALLLLLEELRLRGGEEVAALRLEHVVDPVAVGRVERGLDRRLARGRRSAWAAARPGGGCCTASRSRSRCRRRSARRGSARWRRCRGASRRARRL